MLYFLRNPFDILYAESQANQTSGRVHKLLYKVPVQFLYLNLFKLVAERFIDISKWSYNDIDQFANLLGLERYLLGFMCANWWCSAQFIYAMQHNVWAVVGIYSYV